MILTSERHLEHLFAGRNAQQIALPTSQLAQRAFQPDLAMIRPAITLKILNAMAHPTKILELLIIKYTKIKKKLFVQISLRIFSFLATLLLFFRLHLSKHLLRPPLF